MNRQNPIFIPGPTNMPDSLRAAMNVQSSDHRAPDFEQLLVPLQDNLRKIFKTASAHIITFPSTGTGGWEAAVTNTLSPGDKVLAARYGVFSDRWIDLCQRHGLQVEVIDCEWGAGVPAQAIATALEADRSHEINAILVTHNETATGVRSDVGAIRAALDSCSHPALLLVDCVSSLACMDFRMDEWGVDLAVTGSQKGFMLSAGLAIVAVSEKAMVASAQARCSKTFFDFNDMLAANNAGGYPYTPPVYLLKGLHASVDMLLAEGLDNVFARHFRLAEGIRKAVSAWGLRLCAESPELYSDTVSCIVVPEGFDSNALTQHAYHAYDVSFGVGLGAMAGKAFRIGHLGSLTDVMALSGIATIEMAMKDLKYPIELGQGVAVAQEYYRSSQRISDRPNTDQRAA